MEGQVGAQEWGQTSRIYSRKKLEASGKKTNESQEA